MSGEQIIKDRSFKLAEKYVLETGVSVYLTGRAGTGKTTFLHSIVDACHKRCAVVAPTGVAAINAGGVTIHSFFQLPLCPYLPDIKELITEYQMPEKNTRLKKERVQIFRTLDLLIIDEISMVRADILDAIDYVLRRYRRNDMPFGGVQLLMIGDVQQLPPVVTDSEKPYFDQVYSSPFFFNSKALQKLPYIVIELEKVHRQKDAAFLELLNDFRSGKPSESSLRLINSRYDPNFITPDDGNWIRLTTHNAFADQVNRSKMEELDGEERTFCANVEGNFPENSFPAEVDIHLKVGAQVMFIRNDSSGAGEYYNGKIATVTELDPEVIVTDAEGNNITVEPVEWQNIKYCINDQTHEIEGNLDGLFVQLPLRLAWAITIHKSQGLTFDNVVIDAGSAFSFGQVYVALSRCRSLDGIVLSSRITSRCTFGNEEVSAFESAYTPFEAADQMLPAQRKRYVIDELCSAFDLKSLRYLYNRLNRTYQVELSKKFQSEAIRFNKLSNQDGEYAGLKALKETSEKFIAQIRYIGAGDDDTLLKQRVAKGAAYFSDQLTHLAQESLELVILEIGNKEAKKLFNDQAKDYMKELQFRIELYAKILVKGFDLAQYQKMRTEAELVDLTLKSRKKALDAIVGKS